MLKAYARDGFPVTSLKPSTTYGPMQGMLRQIAWEFSWIDPPPGQAARGLWPGTPCISTCTSTMPLAALPRSGPDAVPRTDIQPREEPPITWAAYHRTAMEVLGREVALIGVPLEALQAHHVPRWGDLPGDFCASHLLQWGETPQMSPRSSR